MKGFHVIRRLRKVQASKGLLRIIRLYLYFRTANHAGVEIPVDVSIGKGFIIWHTQGIVMHGNTIIGDNCAILHQVTLGNTNKDTEQLPRIGSGTTIGAGAKIIGSVVVGEYVTVGANAVVTHDLPDRCTAAGIPASVLRIKDSVSVKNSDYLSYEEWLKKSR